MVVSNIHNDHSSRHSTVHVSGFFFGIVFLGMSQHGSPWNSKSAGRRYYLVSGNLYPPNNAMNIYIYMYAYAYIYIYVCICICINVYVYVFIYIYIYIRVGVGVATIPTSRKRLGPRERKDILARVAMLCKELQSPRKV